ncbi:MAG: hypothetical protein ACI89L_000261 [Phycisphaerales bacterium]|jgi:hypothetical protein
MRALILIDEMFGTCERALIERLEIGLRDEGVEVSIAVPEQLAATGRFDLLGQAYGYRQSRIAPVRKLVAHRLARDLLKGSERDPLDLVHVFGGKAWDLGLDIAANTGASVVFELWRAGLVPRVKAVRPPRNVRFVAAVPGRSIEREVLRESHGVQVRLAPWGGIVSPERTRVFREGREIGIVMVGNGGDTANCRAAFDGIAQVLAARDNTMLFIDAFAADRAGLWKRAKQAGVRRSVSVIDHLEDRRDLILRCDLLVSPESRREHRTILLDAMGAAVPVIAGADETIDILEVPDISVQVRAGTATDWARAVESLVGDPQRARELGEAARRHISENQRWSRYVASVCDIYEWMCKPSETAGTTGTASDSGSA